MFLIAVFPFYFFSGIEHGIGRENSFPSIISKDMKKNFNWQIPSNKINQCKNIFIDGENKHQLKYITTNLMYKNIEFFVENKKKNLKKKICVKLNYQKNLK